MQRAVPDGAAMHALDATVIRRVDLRALAVALRDLSPSRRPGVRRSSWSSRSCSAAVGGQANAWADVDNDGDLDYFVAFRGRPNRFYRNDKGTFRDVASEVGLTTNLTSSPQETRAAAWGDFDADGDADLYLGFADPKIPAKVYRNDAKGTHFVDVAKDIGVKLNGVARQPAWIDYDGDGDLDLFAAFRDVPNRLLRNDRGRFVDVTEASGIGDPRKTVSAVWWDFDRDGDLDLFTANQEGEAERLLSPGPGPVRGRRRGDGCDRHAEAGSGRRRGAERRRFRSRWRLRFVRRQLRPQRALSQRRRQGVHRDLARARHRSERPRRDVRVGRSRQRRLARSLRRQLHRRPAALSRRVVHQRRAVSSNRCPM